MKRVLTALLAGLLAACVDSPGVTSPASTFDDPLAETFEALARVAGDYGDLARSDGFAYAALSVRSGVAPSRLDVQSGDSVETFDAFVTEVQWEPTVPVSFRPPTRRSLVGWRRTGNGSTRVLALTVPADSARILSPMSLGVGASTVAVFAGASAMWNEGRDDSNGRPDLGSAYYGTTGWVKLKEAVVVGPCPDSARHKGAGVSRCEVARYQVAFDVSMQRLTGRPPTVPAGSLVRRASSVAETQVNGLRLRFSCPNPKARTGCA